MIVEAPQVVLPRFYIENEVCESSFRPPPRFEFFPKSGKDPKAGGIGMGMRLQGGAPEI